MNDKLTNGECEENLHEAKATIVLQRKQLASYERLINKQNEKIQLLRTFICKHHGRHKLDKLEAGKSTPSSSSSASNKTDSTNSRRTIPSSLKQKATAARSKLSTNTDNTMMHIRLGQKDMHSFFFDSIESSSQARHWETISSISPTNNHRDVDHAPQAVDPAPTTSPSPPPALLLSILLADNNQDTNVNVTTSVSEHVDSYPPQSPRSITEISSQSSHTTDGGSFIIEDTPQRHSRIVSPIAITPVHHRQEQQQQQQQPQKDALWETLTHFPKSPSDRHHHTPNQKQKQQQKQQASVYNNYQPSTTISTFGQYRDQLYRGSASTSAVAAASSSTTTHKRNSLASIDANVLHNDDYFLKRPDPDSDFPYAEVVRKKGERAKLHGVTCTCCAKYFESSTGTPTTIQDRIQKYSRHRERYKQPSTPPGFWDLDFPDSPHH